MSNILDHLICPITHDWLEDPISVPCCGRVFSRQSLSQSYSLSTTCPICRSDISSFNVETAPKNTTIANIVELSKSDDSISLPTIMSEIIPLWSANMKILNKPISCLNRTRIGHLEIVTTDKSLQSGDKILLILVVDKSGSMGGAPIAQANYAVEHVIRTTQGKSNVKLVIIAYDNVADIVDLNNPYIVVRGGTSFSSAFKGIEYACTLPENLSI